METRKQLLFELLQLQERLGIGLIDEEETELIKKLWINPRYRRYRG